jgi:hypothetical protein
VPEDEENRQQQRLAPVEEVTLAGTAPAFASAGEALDMVRAGLGYPAARLGKFAGDVEIALRDEHLVGGR